jgi:hypothetical protein
MPPLSAELEAQAISRYLVGRECAPPMVERYAKGRALMSGVSANDEVVSFAFHHSWSLPFLDAAAAIVRGGEALHARVLLMAAVLEASPDFATAFLPREVSGGRLVTELAGNSLAAGARLVIGLPLLLLLRRPWSVPVPPAPTRRRLSSRPDARC